MNNLLEVEVTYKGYVYKAFVDDVLEDGLKVHFEKNWEPPTTITFDNIRFPPENSDSGFKSKQLVEVRQNDNELKVDYWRKAILKELDMQTGRWLVDFIPYIYTCTEQSRLKLSDIRHINDKRAINRSTLTKIEIEIPEELRKIAAASDNHAEFQKQVQADICMFIPESNVLRIISRHGEVTRRRVGLLKDLHLLHLQDKFKRSNDLNEEKYCEEFKVAESLMGLALGKRYANIKEARKIKDVTKVELIENSLIIQVCGRTKEAVKEARNMIEFIEYPTSIPRYLAEEILEDDGKIIHELVQKSGLVRIESGEDEDEFSNSSDYPIIFVGNPHCVENAKILLEYQLHVAEQRLKEKQKSESESTVAVNSNLVVEHVVVPPSVKGLVIGKNFSNVKKAENIPGIVKVEIPSEMPMLIIHAESESAAKEARKLLEYDARIVEAQQNELGKIIGKNGVTIKRIESLCDGVRVRIPSKIQPSDLTKDGKVMIRVAGPVSGVTKAVSLLETARVNGRLC